MMMMMMMVDVCA